MARHEQFAALGESVKIQTANKPLNLRPITEEKRRDVRERLISFLTIPAATDRYIG
jgi:hypothetical protein